MESIPCPQGCNKGFHHSSGDGWDEWNECRCCNPNGDAARPGTVSKKRLAEFRKAEADEDARAEAMVAEWQQKMSKPCPKCGVALIDHANRDGEPCKSIEEWNREYLASKSVRASPEPAQGET